ncbi:MAG: hypothetical protein NTV86_20360 [Planctomycetota bacterium]|nr:hypothetical protein [Planctomycetota bacterium]
MNGNERTRIGGVALAGLAAAVGLLALPGCLGPPALFDDSWNDRGKSPDFDWQKDAVKTWDLLPQEQAGAQKLLVARPWAPLTEQDAHRLGGKEVGTPALGTPYLLRGVYLLENGRFHVYVKDGQVVVINQSMGCGTVWRVKRRGLIVRLKAPPISFFTTCMIAV